MGKPILYCSDCGRSLREEDFERGRAGHADRRPYCTECRPDLKPVTPRSVPRPPLDRTPPSGHRRLPAARPSSRALPIALSAVGGGLLMVALVAGLSSSKKPDPPPPTNAPVRFVAKTPEAPPSPATNAPVRFVATPKAAEPEPPPAPAPSLDRWLEQIRDLRKGDPDFRRADEVRSMLRKAAEIAGPRRQEVDALLSAYETELAKPAPAPATSAFLLKIASFTLINADIDKPVPGYDPMSPDCTVELGKLGMKKIDVRLNAPSSGVGSVEVVLNGKGRAENAFPYSCTTNSATGGFDGWLPSPGRQTIKARIWSQKDRKGQAGPWVDFSFTVADPR